MPRRYDPDRRQRIIDAAIRVIGARGIAGLGHRAVAAEADVPLGSTTYHFATLDDLLVAALRQINTAWLAEVGRWARRPAPRAALAEDVTDLIEQSLAGDRAQVEMEYEIYLAALRRTAVRPIAAECLDELARLLTLRTGDAQTARTLVALIDGLLIQYLLTGRPFDRAEVHAAVSGVCGPAHHGQAPDAH
ncbi:TetR family transcriptional regulator [Streptomyces sp. MST-110588]|uniref:TetR/AcrR family transcriptional regulator n=1 Tax=Streptomyces sp. MST-110588 TaxID=2833628 RepID=UPI001F5D3F56|nr:TetR family transcriptional regulator [Streptomyces sp. MST-110588]UNO42734.1 TetR family transcriptional regulator [Streptomyces sp. MST-110588]